ncbi:MAG: copper ion binding protein, partial [Pseudomonadota bacterium]
MRTLSIPITNMSCAGCVRRVETAVTDVSGVSDVSANLATGRLTVVLGAQADAGAVATALEHAGYPPETVQADLRVTGMNCGACVSRVEAALLAQPGVLAASANLASGTARVTAIGGATTPAALATALTTAGYAAEAMGDATDPDPADEGRALRRRALLAAVLTAP